MMGKVAWVAGADRREAPGPKPARLGPTPQVGFPPIRLRRQPPGSSQLWNGGVQRGVSVFPARFRTGWSEVTTCQRLTQQTLRANWLRFSGSVPPLVNLSHNMPTINTTGKLASFWRFSLTASSHRADSLTSGYCSRATGHCSFASCPTSGVKSCADSSPLATAIYRQPNWQRPNGARSRRAVRPYSVCHRNAVCYRTR